MKEQETPSRREVRTKVTCSALQGQRPKQQPAPATHPPTTTLLDVSKAQQQAITRVQPCADTHTTRGVSINTSPASSDKE